MAVALMSTACRDLLGLPWQAGGRDPRVALGCYGLVLELYRRCGVAAPTLWQPAADGSDVHAFSMALMASLPDFWDPIPGPEPMALAVLPSDWCATGGHCGVVLADDVLAHATIRQGTLFEPLPRARLRVLAWYRLRGTRWTVRP